MIEFYSRSFQNGEPLPARLAFARAHPVEKFELSGNRNPHLAWTTLPAATRSVVIVCYDVDVPDVFDDVNRDGVELPVDMPRRRFSIGQSLVCRPPADRSRKNAV